MNIQSLSSYATPVALPTALPQQAAEVASAPQGSIVDKFETSHLPSSEQDKSEADRLAEQEAKANKHLKGLYALGSVFDGAVRSLGQMGMMYGLMQGVLGHQLGGWLAVAAGVGGAITVTDAAFQTKMAAVNRNTSAAIKGSFSMVQGLGATLTAAGLGRIPAFVSIAATLGSTAYSIYEASKAKKKKEAAEQEDVARRAAEKAAQEAAKQPAEQQPAAKVEAHRGADVSLLTKSVGGSAFSAMRPILAT